mgnify:CR=1 FL=1
MDTFYNFKLDLEPNIIDMIYDLLRMSTIQIITQVMFYMNNSSLSLFNETFIKTFIFINISIIFYYLVVRKVFSFVSDDYLNVESKPYAGTPPIGNSTTAPRMPTPAAPPPAPPTPPPAPPAQPTANSNSLNIPTGSTNINANSNSNSNSNSNTGNV